MMGNVSAIGYGGARAAKGGIGRLYPMSRAAMRRASGAWQCAGVGLMKMAGGAARIGMS
jgi:hypothetical protein